MCVPVTPRPHNICVPPTCAVLEACAQYNCCAPAVKMLGGTTLEAPLARPHPTGSKSRSNWVKTWLPQLQHRRLLQRAHTLPGLQCKQQGACREAATAPAAACTL